MQNSSGANNYTLGDLVMTSNTLGIVVGGVVPAICFGLSGIFAKSSTNHGISTGLYLLIVGAAVVVTGGMYCLVEGHYSISVRSGIFAALAGLVWAVGAGLVAFALNQYGTPISKLVPLYNTNTLVAVALGVWVFAEWKELSVGQLFIGSTFVVIGGVLVAKA